MSESPNTVFGLSYSQILGLIVVVAVAVTLERLITTYLSRLAKREA